MDYLNLKIPTHVAIILDGNGRWAKDRGLSRSIGHKHGFNNLKRVSKYVFSNGIKVLSVYAFSTENFKRSKEEVDYLMDLFVNLFEKEFDSIIKEDIKFVFSGTKESPLPQKVIKVMNKIEEATKNNSKGIFNFCINYGGRQELVNATKEIVKEVVDGNLNIDDLNTDVFEGYLHQTLPPIDLLIRTSGEQRISNFMLYQAAYAEFYFPKVHFPDFNESEFDAAIVEYTKRDRRFGGINYEKKSD